MKRIFLMALFLTGCANNHFTFTDIGEGRYYIAVDSHSPARASSVALRQAREYCAMKNQKFVLISSRGIPLYPIASHEVIFSCSWRVAKKGKEADILTLERREGESLVIQHNCEELLIALTEIHNGKAKVSLKGPRSFNAARKEIVEVVECIEELLNEWLSRICDR